MAAEKKLKRVSFSRQILLRCQVWIFHVMTGPDNAGAVWAAQRLKDDHVTVVANGFTIRLVFSSSLIPLIAYFRLYFVTPLIFLETLQRS